MKKVLFLICAASIFCACKQICPVEPPVDPQDTTKVIPPDTSTVTPPDTTTTSDSSMRQPKPMTFATVDEQLAYRTNEFTFNLTSLVCANPDKPNIILSPLSASLMLGMVMNGADGETLAQMQQALGFEGLTQAQINEWYKNLIERLPALDTVTTVRIANSIWVDNGFPVKQAYIDVNRQYFHATADNVNMADPATADLINQWAADNTNDLIKKVVESRDIANCVMVLANALYFKSKWLNPFDPSNTHKSDFDPLAGSRIKIDMMSDDIYGYYADIPEGQLLEMDYKGSKYCMDVLLPAKGADIRQVVAGLTTDSWNDMLSQLQYDQVWVRFPKFKLKYNRTLTDDLKAAGMPKALSTAAEFPYVSDIPVFLSWVKQACCLAVDEDGTEAAAVTIGGYEATGMGPDKAFIIDRPFFLVIREKQQGNILFTAMITNPEAE